MAGLTWLEHPGCFITAFSHVYTFRLYSSGFGWVLLYVHRNRRLIRDGEPRTATSTFTQLLRSVVLDASLAFKVLIVGVNNARCVLRNASTTAKARAAYVNNKRLRSLLVYLPYVYRALVSSLVGWFCWSKCLGGVIFLLLLLLLFFFGGGGGIGVTVCWCGRYFGCDGEAVEVESRNISNDCPLKRSQKRCSLRFTLFDLYTFTLCIFKFVILCIYYGW